MGQKEGIRLFWFAAVIQKGDSFMAIHAQGNKVLHSVVSTVDMVNFYFLSFATNLTGRGVTFKDGQKKAAKVISTSRFNAFLKSIGQVLLAQWPTFNGRFIAKLASTTHNSFATKFIKPLPVFREMLFAIGSGFRGKRFFTLAALPVGYPVFVQPLGVLFGTVKAYLAIDKTFDGLTTALATAHSTIYGLDNLVSWKSEGNSSFFHAAVY